MGLKIALVKFVKEKKLYIVNIEDILDFTPKHKDDFSKSKVYSVNWPILRREGSSPTAKSEPFPANILLLAGSKTSMINQAAKAKVKLPPGFASQETQPAPDSVSMIKQVSSKRAKQAVNAAMVTECEKRMQNIMQVHVMNENNILKMQEANLHKLVKEDNLTPQPKSDNKLEQTEANKYELGQKDSPTRQSESDNKVQQTPEKTRHNLRKRIVKDNDSADDSEGDETCSFVSSAVVKRQLEDRIIELQQNLASEKKKARILETELESIKRDFEKLQELFSMFSRQSQAIFSLHAPVRCSPMAKWISSPAKHSKGSPDKTLVNSPGEVIRDKPANSARKRLFSPSKVSSPQAKHSKASPYNIFTNSPGEVMKAETPNSARKGLFSPSWVSSPQAKHSKASPAKAIINSPGEVMEENPPNSARKRLISESSSPQGKQNKKKKKEKDVPRQSLGADELDNKKIGTHIYSVFKKTGVIQDNGKFVNIGNNTWVKKELWEKHFSKPNIKHSILVKDLAEEVWGWRKCGRMSLLGGKSPKTPDAELKPPAPLGAVEAILGVYRAKLMMEGIMVDTVLDDLVETKGRGIFLRGKFQDCAKKLKKEEAK